LRAFRLACSRAAAVVSIATQRARLHRSDFAPLMADGGGFKGLARRFPNLRELSVGELVLEEETESLTTHDPSLL